MTWISVLAAAISGLVQAVIAPPANLHWLHWASFLPLFWALRQGHTRRNALLGYIAGYLATFSIFFWLTETIVRFSNIPFFLALSVTQLFAIFFSLPWALLFGLVHPTRQRMGIAWIVLVPAYLVAIEYLFPQLFPVYQGVSQYRVPWTSQLASITGVRGISWLLMLVNCSLAEIIYRRREGRSPPWKVLALAATLFLGNIIYGAWRYGEVDEFLLEAPTIQVGIVQQDVTMEERLSGTFREAVESWFRDTARLYGQNIDLVVWPEGASPYNPHEEPMKEALGKLVERGDFEILVGGGTYEEPEGGSTSPEDLIFYNSCYFMDRDGNIAGRYDKMVPLPFGEYIPFSNTFPVLRTLIRGPGDFRAGTHPTVFQAEGFTFTTPICYEAILPRIVRRMMNADLLINITNDAWFGDTRCPYQHAMLAAIRAVEFGRPMLRIAYTGISMIVEPQGRITYETKPFTRVTTVKEIRLGRVDTIYRRWGDWFAILCTLVSGISIALLWYDAHGKGSAQDAPEQR